MCLSVGAVSLFGIFTQLILWIESRRKEREASYKAETIRRLARAGFCIAARIARISDIVV